MGTDCPWPLGTMLVMAGIAGVMLVRGVTENCWGCRTGGGGGCWAGAGEGAGTLGGVGAGTGELLLPFSCGRLGGRAPGNSCLREPGAEPNITELVSDP